MVLYLGASNGDIGDAWNAMRNAKVKWLVGAGICWLIFVVLESMIVHLFFKQQGYKVRFSLTMHVSLIGMFYSSVTPAATGGQPMQIFAFKKRNIPPGVSTSALAVKLFCWQTALLVMGCIMWITNADVINSTLGATKAFVIIGFILNGAIVVLVVLLSISRNIVQVLITLVINIGAKLHIVKDIGRTTSHADATISDFRASVDMMTHHPLRLFGLVLISCVQVFSLMSITFFVYRAIGEEGTSFSAVTALQFMLYTGASFTPLPGASGAQEGGFYLFYQGVIAGDKLLGALLLWRFFTYYLQLIIGMVSVVVESSVNMRRLKRENSKKEENG